MDKKLVNSIILGLEIGSLGLVGILTYKNRQDIKKLKLNFDDINMLEPKIKQEYNGEINLENIKRINIRNIVKKFYKTMSKDKDIDLTNFNKN